MIWPSLKDLTSSTYLLSLEVVLSIWFANHKISRRALDELRSKDQCLHTLESILLELKNWVKSTAKCISR